MLAIALVESRSIIYPNEDFSTLNNEIPSEYFPRLRRNERSQFKRICPPAGCSQNGKYYIILIVIILIVIPFK